MENDQQRKIGEVNWLHTQVGEINRQLGAVTSMLERAVEDRREVGRALGEFRDDINELMALGPQVSATLEKATKNEARIETIEQWRQRHIGASSAVHYAIGTAGGVVVLIGDMLYRFFTGGLHR
jgi:hypothetical protein